MSQENLERVRRIHAEWARGNWQAGADAMTPDVHISWQVPEGSIVAHGIEEVGPKLRSFHGQWQEFRSEPQEFVELDNDAVFVVALNQGVGKTSGVSVEATCFYIWRFRDGLVVRMHSGFDRDETLEAARLSE